MKPSRPVVVDTSVHLSSEVFGRAGSPAKEVLARAFADHFDVAISAALLDELARKLIECGAPANDVADYLATVRAVSI